MPAYRIKRFDAHDWQTFLPVILTVGFWLYFRGIRKVPR